MPDRIDPELAAEQAYVTAAYARLEAMRAAAERVRTAYADVRAGGTHQARLERDIAWDVTQRRLADLDIGESPLVFGRLDLETRRPLVRRPARGRGRGPHAARRRLARAGRRAVLPGDRGRADGRRAPPPPDHPQGPRGRSASTTRCSTSTRSRTRGSGSRARARSLAALERNRTGRMGDIVATIQAEQDEAIRADVHGVLVVGGRSGHRQDRGRAAPGRVPPLHAPAPAREPGRAARRAEPGVPPLHRAGAPVARRAGRAALDDLGPEAAAARRRDRARTASRQLKGDARMARVDRSARSPTANVRCARDLIVLIDGLRVRVCRAPTPRASIEGTRRRRDDAQREPPVRRAPALRPARRALQERGDPRVPRAQHRLAPADNVTSIFDRDSALDATIAGTLARGEPTPEGWEQELRVALPRPARGQGGARAHVAGAVGRRSSSTTSSGSARSCVRRRASMLDDDEQELLHRRRDPDVTRAPWTEADLALVDEADALLGPVEAARPAVAAPQRRRRHATTPPSGSSTISGCAASPTRRRSPTASASRRNGNGAARTRRSSRARSATCSSTRRRTSPRCSGGCWPGGARRAR